MPVHARTKKRESRNETPTLFPTPLGPYEVLHADAFDWLAHAKPCSIHAVVTDPPYGLIEYTPRELEKMKNGRGGVWRIPPSFDGCRRKPLPRFTVLTDAQRTALRTFFHRLAESLFPVVVPGAHVFIATNPLVSHLVYVTRGDDVRTTIVNCRVLMRDRKMLSLDEPRVLADARAYADKVRAAVK